MQVHKRITFVKSLMKGVLVQWNLSSWPPTDVDRISRTGKVLYSLHIRPPL